MLKLSAKKKYNFVSVSKFRNGLNLINILGKKKVRTQLKIKQSI